MADTSGTVGIGPRETGTRTGTGPTAPTARAMAGDPPRIDFIQAMRAIAALIVVTFHIVKEAYRLGLMKSEPLFRFSESLQFGVDLFFIISGFIMVYVMRDKAATPRAGRLFLEKRLLRVVPLYWLFTLLTAATIAWLPQAVHATQIDLPYLIASLLFVPWPSANSAGLLPVLGLGWTLVYEMFFYLIYAGLIALGVRRRVTWLCAIFGVLVLIGTMIGIDHPQLWYFTRSTEIMFAFGAIVATMFVRGRAIVPEWAALAICALGVLLWQLACWNGPAFVPEWRGLLLGVPAALIMFGVMRSRLLVGALGAGRAGAILQTIGDASYSLYIAHMFMVRLSTILLHRIAPHIGFGLYLIVTLSICVLGAILIHRWVEKPLLVLGGRLLPRRHAVAPAVR